ncbi:receptor-type tyrosine-protein phosphatase delta [Exaiptasia diaphana]|uniref:Fibronectin type-III domain-containing protein n=1 Tax=Exaiptasia diaphana TaxID=2652724 RepID=A0A913YNA9_EXADI|nr:receptor-type tyrosine-protein phosphatase delta [Exaiptasia diaphana]
MWNSRYHGTESDIATATTQEDEPEGKPSDVSATPKSSRSIEVTWKLPHWAKFNGPSTGFRITYTDARRIKKTKLVRNVRKAFLSDLKKWMRYSITVSMWNSKYYGTESNIATATTKEDEPEGKPSDVSATPKSSTSIEVTWKLPHWAKFNGPSTGFRITYTDARRIKKTKLVRNVRKAFLSDLKKWMRYSITVSMWNSKYYGTESNIATATTKEDEPEGKPSDVSATPKSSRSIEVAWKLSRWAKFNGPSTGFRITYTDARRIKKTKLVRNVRKTLLTNLNKWMTYSITVSMWNSRYYGTESNIATATTKEDVPEGRPSGVSATPKSSTSIEVTWKLSLIAFYYVIKLVPDIAPQGIEVTEQNKTTFIIAWQPLPRNKANGNIIKYKVVWALRHIGRAKRMAVGDTFTGTTKGTQFVLNGLRLCAKYEVRVAAATKIGLGPNATQDLTTSRPGEPHHLRPLTIRRAFIILIWEKPKGIKEDETNYTVHFKGSKPYWSEYRPPLKTKTQAGRQTTLKIDNLQPGTHYEFWVTALTVCGESNRSLTVTVETQVDKPHIAQQVTPLILKDSSNVTLWTFKPHNGPISSYHVIVVSGRNKSMTEIPENLSDYKKASSNNELFYITAELKPDQIKTAGMFVIGDNRMYGIYKNVPLVKGQAYTVAERAITKYNGETYASDPVHIATIELTAESTNHAEQSKSTPPSSVIIGVVVSLLVLVVILSLLGFKYKRSRIARNDCSDISLDDIVNDPDGSSSKSSRKNPKTYVDVDVGVSGYVGNAYIFNLK